MFFIFGIYPKQIQLDYAYNHLDIHNCGKYSKIRIIALYYVLSIFFLPIFKFGKKYYAVFDCCGKTYELDKENGKSIERGNNPPLDIDYSDIVDEDYQYICQNCHKSLNQDFEYCPYCGKKL